MKTEKSEPTITMYVHIEDCEGWWLSGCCGSVAEHWWLKPEGVLGSTPGDCWPFHISLFLPDNIFIPYLLMSGHGYGHKSA